MDATQLLKKKRKDILKIAEAHGARNVCVFGSAVRGEAGETSDFDFLVESEPGTSLLTHARLIVALEDLLGRTVDAVPSRMLKERIRDRVLAEAEPL